MHASGTCDAADFNGTQNAKLLNVDDQDAGVYWNTLDGDKVYCIGVVAAHGDDAAGTFLRAAQDTPPTSSIPEVHHHGRPHRLVALLRRH